MCNILVSSSPREGATGLLADRRLGPLGAGKLYLLHNHVSVLPLQLHFLCPWLLLQVLPDIFGKTCNTGRFESCAATYCCPSNRGRFSEQICTSSTTLANLPSSMAPLGQGNGFAFPPKSQSSLSEALQTSKTSALAATERTKKPRQPPATLGQLPWVQFDCVAWTLVRCPASWKRGCNKMLQQLQQEVRRRVVLY